MIAFFTYMFGFVVEWSASCCGELCAGAVVVCHGMFQLVISLQSSLG